MSGSTTDARTRTRLAVWLVLFSIGGIVVTAIVAIAVSDDRAGTTQLVFSAMLPLFGTWVGTVLAFYFARENLDAATRSAESAARSAAVLTGRELATPVTQVMIREAQFHAYDLGGQDPSSVPLSELRAKMGEMQPPWRRLPIRNAAGAVLYVLHDSTLNAFTEHLRKEASGVPVATGVDQNAGSGDPGAGAGDPGTGAGDPGAGAGDPGAGAGDPGAGAGDPGADIEKTLGDLLAVPEFKEFLEAIGFVSEKASVGDARAVLESVEYCNDVFVTTTGKRDERAIGWLTNTLLAGIQ
jgi:hypothetical protein